MLRRSIQVAVLALAGCGSSMPAVQQTQMALYPPRPANCELAIINGATTDLSIMATPTSKYVMVGTIAITEQGTQQPLSQKYMAIIGPRACQMGGDAVTLIGSSTGGDGLGGNSTGTAYLVLHARAAAP